MRTKLRGVAFLPRVGELMKIIQENSIACERKEEKKMSAKLTFRSGNLCHRYGVEGSYFGGQIDISPPCQSTGFLFVLNFPFGGIHESPFLMRDFGTS